MNQYISTTVKTIHMKAKWFHFQPPIPGVTNLYVTESYFLGTD